MTLFMDEPFHLRHSMAIMQYILKAVKAKGDTTVLHTLQSFPHHQVEVTRKIHQKHSYTELNKFG